jgi:hypothetical protein
MSPRRSWDSPTPSLASECAPPTGTKGGWEHSRAGEGLGEYQFQRLEKRLSTLHAYSKKRARGGWVGLLVHDQNRYIRYTKILEFLNNLWGLGTE